MLQVSLMSVEELEKEGLLEQLIAAYPGTLKEPENFKKHCYDSAMIIREVLNRAVFHNFDEFDLQIDKKEMEVAAYLHDIGRILRKDQTFHELTGADFIEKEGLRLLGKGLTEKHKKILFRIAETIRSHFVVFEQYKDMREEYKGDIKEMEIKGIKIDDPYLLLPTTWNQKFIVYAELSNVKGQKISPQQRMEELEERYSRDSNYKDERFLKSFRLGKERVFKVCEIVDNLIRGKYEDKPGLVKRYGFLR